MANWVPRSPETVDYLLSDLYDEDLAAIKHAYEREIAEEQKRRFDETVAREEELHRSYQLMLKHALQRSNIQEGAWQAIALNRRHDPELDAADAAAATIYDGRLGNPQGRGYGGSNEPWPFNVERALRDPAYRASIRLALQDKPKRVFATAPYAQIWKQAASIDLRAVDEALGKNQ